MQRQPRRLLSSSETAAASVAIGLRSRFAVAIVIFPGETHLFVTFIGRVVGPVVGYGARDAVSPSVIEITN